MEDCVKVPEDLDKLKAMGDAFRHPKKLIIDSMKNVLLNGVSIYDDIEQANKDLHAGQFEKAGELYGTIGASVVWGADLYNMGAAFLQV